MEVSWVWPCPVIYTLSVRWSLFVSTDILRCRIVEISSLSDINGTCFDRQDVSWCLAQQISGMIHETDDLNQVMLYDQPNYSHFIDSQTPDFALFKMIQRTNLDTKMQLASILPISFNIKHLAQHQSQHKLQCSRNRHRTFCHFRGENTANWKSGPHDNVIMWMKAPTAWKQKDSKPRGHWAACDPKRSFRQRSNNKHGS